MTNQDNAYWAARFAGSDWKSLEVEEQAACRGLLRDGWLVWDRSDGRKRMGRGPKLIAARAAWDASRL